MADATVICSIERLFDWEPAGEAVIGVTLSVAWSNTSKAPPDNFLLPWKWLPWQQGPEQLGFYLACFVPGDPNVTPKFSATPIFPLTLTRNQKTISSIRNNGDYQDFADYSLQPRYDLILKTPANLGYPAGGRDTITVTAASSDKPGDASLYGSGARWPSILADLSTRPAPIPQALLLSFIFNAGKIANLLPLRNDGTTPAGTDCSLVIAPILKARATGMNSDTNPVIDPTAKPLNAGIDPASMLWNYSDNTYQASCQKIGLGMPPVPKSFFDMATRLVKAPPGEKWHFNEDWQSSFESRLAERLDLSAELARILEKESFDDTAARNVIDAALAALRDVAGIGIDLTPSHVSFLQASNVDQKTISDIGTALSTSANFKQVEGWKAFLQMAFHTPETSLSDPYLADIELWSAKPIKAADAVRQFNRVRQRVLSPDALWVLLQLQISSLAAGASVKRPDDLNTLAATLRAENLGRYWRKGLLGALASTGGTYSVENIRAALKDQLQKSAITRFQDGTFLPAVSAAIAADAQAALNTQTSQDDWKAAALYVIPVGASAPSTDAGAGGAALAAQGITIQINELGDTGDLPSKPDEVADVRKLQGAGLLLAYDISTRGKVSTAGYKCLNYVDVCYQRLSGGTRKIVILEQAALAPLRFTWHNGVALATVSYNNEPLPASGPLSRAAKLVSTGVQTSEVMVDTDLLWYRYSSAAQTITALTFGRDYHPQPFLVSNAGALPKSLATTYLDLKASGELDKAKGIGDTWATIPYRRQKTPGALRLSNPQGSPEKHLKLPTIPDGVFRRAQATGNDQPMVMLVPDHDRFTRDLPTAFAVNVRPPATDLLSWDRFVNGFSNDLAGSRAGVFNGFFAAIRRHTDQMGDVTIDDPATVYSGYVCRLYYELLDENGKPVRADFISFPPPSGTGLSAVQAGALSLNFVAGKDEAKSKPPSIQVTAPNVTVTVYEGRFATLKLHACVHKDYVGRFEQGLLNSVGTLKESYYLMPSTDMMVEVVSDALPAMADLFDGKRFGIGAFNTSDGNATISLDLAGIQNDKYVYNAEVLRQVWKWQGRPVLPLPPMGLPSSDWLTREFGNRAEIDLLRVPMVPPRAESGSRTFIFTEERGSVLSDSERASGNLQQSVSTVSTPAESRLLGTYIRYGVQVESRYKPLLLKNSFVRARASDGSQWRDLYIPSRKLTQIKPPNVKLILPLTRNPSDPTNGPGLLVMLRGPWFQECGLGERLEAQIMLVETPEEDPSSAPPRTFYYQYGSDPILSNPSKRSPVKLNEATDKTGAGWTDSRNVIKGPIGHTFDTVSSGQLFVNTSFVLNYPNIDNLGWTPWSFAKVQVRRVVDVIGSSSPTGLSDWSQPLWIQLIPDFDLYSGDAQFTDLTLKYIPASGDFQLLNNANQLVTLAAGNGDAIYANYLAITHFISDVTGVVAQEAYDGIYRQSGADWIPIGNASVLPAEIQPFCRGRVLTVQGKNVSLTHEDDFWTDIFAIEKDPDNSTGDFVQDVDRLRIVGVSRPIDLPNAQYRGC